MEKKRQVSLLLTVELGLIFFSSCSSDLYFFPSHNLSPQPCQQMTLSRLFHLLLTAQVGIPDSQVTCST